MCGVQECVAAGPLENAMSLPQFQERVAAGPLENTMSLPQFQEVLLSYSVSWMFCTMEFRAPLA